MNNMYNDASEELKCGIKVAGMILHMLLFADDIVLMSGSIEGLQ